MANTVLLLHFGDDGIRGTEMCLIQSAQAFMEKNFKVVICRNYPVMDQFLNHVTQKPVLITLQFPEIMIAGKKETSLPIRSYLRSLKRLSAIVREFRPSLIYCNAGLPCQLGIPVGRIHHIPVICHFHHPAIKRAYYLWLVVLANKLIFPSQFTRNHSYEKAGIRGEVVYNGIDLKRFQPAAMHDPRIRANLDIADQAIVIGQVAQLVAHKRPDLLIRALSAVRKCCDRPIHLCLVGKGPMEASLRCLAASYGIQDYVTITGYVDDVLPYYQHVFDINVLVSKEEGLGISAIEGSACGLPLVVTRCTGLAETVIQNETGLSFELNEETEVDELCCRLLFLINNPVARFTMGIAGRAYAKRKFSAESYNDRITEIADSMLVRHS